MSPLRGSRISRITSVAIENVRADHRIAAHAQREGAQTLRRADQARVEGNHLIAFLLGERGHARGDLAENWNVRDRPAIEH